MAYPDIMVAIEVDGGTWSGGRHTTGSGFQADCEKVNEAVLMGWKVVRFTSTHIKSGVAVQTIERLLKGIRSGDCSRMPDVAGREFHHT